MNIDGVSLAVFSALFLFVTVLGFAAVRWRRTESLAYIDEWGLGGRSFGSFVTWFLLGGDLYTAYTFVAVPALMFGAGAIGFFAVPYTIIVYPLVFVFMPRLWSVSHRHGTSPRPTSSAVGSAHRRSRSQSPSPASSPRCPTSHCSWSASRPCSTRWVCTAAAGRRICRWRSRSQSSRPTPTPVVY